MNRQQRRLQQRQMKKQPQPVVSHEPVVELPDKYFLKGTRFKRIKMAFIFRRGGLGDYINFMSTIFFIADTCPHIKGTIYVSEPFYHVAKYLVKDLELWTVRRREDIKDMEPGTHYSTFDPAKLPINATGAHLMDLGSMYYVNLQQLPPEYRFLPRIKYRSGKDWGLPKRYAVFTPGYTAESRRVHPQYYNELTKYCESLGITPVHLGKRHFSPSAESNAMGYKAKINENFDLSVGVDLTEKTTLLEAVEVMEHAEFVIGLDNGLLHFAGTTEVPIIFGHNIAAVHHRSIRRPKGLTINIEIPRDVLSCIGCQSYMRFTDGHRHNKCIYEGQEPAYACLDILFSNGCETWKKAIDQVVETKKKLNPTGS